MTLAPTTELVLQLDDDPEIITTWERFTRENDLDDEPAWRDEIITTLTLGNIYHGGGGAHPEYTLQILETPVRSDTRQDIRDDYYEECKADAQSGREED